MFDDYEFNWLINDESVDQSDDRINVRKHVHIIVCLSVCLSVNMSVCMYVYMYACMPVCMYICVLYELNVSKLMWFEQIMTCDARKNLHCILNHLSRVT